METTESTKKHDAFKRKYGVRKTSEQELKEAQEAFKDQKLSAAQLRKKAWQRKEE